MLTRNTQCEMKQKHPLILKFLWMRFKHFGHSLIYRSVTILEMYLSTLTTAPHRQTCSQETPHHRKRCYDNTLTLAAYTNDIKSYSDKTFHPQQSKYLFSTLPLTGALYLERRSAEQLKWQSPPFSVIQKLKVREKSPRGARLIRLACLKEEQKVFLLHFPLTSMLLHTQETPQPQWPMSHISSGCGDRFLWGMVTFNMGVFYLAVVLDR